MRSVAVLRGTFCALSLSVAAAASGPACLPSNVISIWGGARHNIMLLADGTVWDLGYNWFGKLGDNTVSNPPDYVNDRHVPIAVHGPNDVGTLSSIIAVMGGESHNFALRADQTVWAWGWNMFGQVGDASYNDAHVPVQVANLTSIKALGGRGYHSLALDTNGDVWCWGLGTSGQLGDGNTSTSNIPLKVQGLGGAAAAVTGGYVTSFALMPDHTVRSWGGNNNGQLGNGSPAAYSATPVTVMGLANVAQISAGWKHVLAVTMTGDVYAWGLNLNHELGYGGTMDSHVPAQVPGISNVVQVSGGDCHSAALKADGTVWTWGC
ncbi:MAG TPA: hypothetical protein VGR00_03515, partial [Thermoanaerobaculia bacterium]|nr:hypothetical protein [Thermoanaerobaculia bacterium]